MFLRLRRGPHGVDIELLDVEDHSSFWIDVGAEIAISEMTRALFESGAAVQQSDDAFLISRDWLSRHGAGEIDSRNMIPMSDSLRCVVMRSSA